MFYQNTRWNGTVGGITSGSQKLTGSFYISPHTIEQKLNYIHLNPMRGKWNLITDPSDYYYSSCRFYEMQIKDFDFPEDYRNWSG